MEATCAALCLFAATVRLNDPKRHPSAGIVIFGRLSGYTHPMRLLMPPRFSSSAKMPNVRAEMLNYM